MFQNNEDRKAIILKAGVPFTTWSSDLRGALTQENLVSHVLHDILVIRLKTQPIKSDATGMSEDYEKYLDKLEM